MKSVPLVLIAVAAVALVAALATMLTWQSALDVSIADVQADFEANEALADSAPQQQVVAAWATKDASLLNAASLQRISSQLTTISALLATIAMATIAAGLGFVLGSKSASATAGEATAVDTPVPVTATEPAVSPTPLA